MNFEPWTIALLISGIVYLSNALFVFWYFRSSAGARSFIALMLAAFIYSTGYFYELHSSNITGVFFWLKVEYIGIAPLPALWIIFVQRYTKFERYLNRKVILALFIIPLITYIMVFTNDSHHLFYNTMSIKAADGLSFLQITRGPWYWVTFFYSNLLTLSGNVFLLQIWRQTPKPLNQQYAAMFVGSLAPWAALLIYVTGNSPLNLDLIPFGMIFAGVVYLYSLIHYRIFDIMPVASTIVLEKMQDGVLVIDTQKRVVDMNGSAVRFFGKKSEIIGCRVETLFQPGSAISANIMNAAAGQWEFKEDSPDGPYWLDMLFSPITNFDGEPQGYTIIIRDITKRKLAQSQLELTNAELSRRIQELHKYNQEMKQLNEMSTQLQACKMLEEAYPLIEGFMQILVPELGGGLYILGQETNQMELVVSWGDFNKEISELAKDECRGLSRGEVYRVGPEHPEQPCTHVEMKNQLDYICQPLMVEGFPFGLLHYHYRSSDLSDNQMQLALIVVDAVKLALTNLKMKEDLRQESIRDPLTGLFNRRYLAETLKLEIFKAHRSNKPLSIIMIDIDYYKQINDCFGHPRGDQILILISQLFMENIRSGDIACRYGGDEFILVLPGAPMEVAFTRAELIRQETRNMNINFDEGWDHSVTISMGVSSYPDNGNTVEALIQAADKALYRAKQEGRNRTSAAG